jgi:tetratricopeptide (TPR) repeat protein
MISTSQTSPPEGAVLSDPSQSAAAAAWAADALAARVRAPEGIFPERWFNSAAPGDAPAMDLNHLPVILAYWTPRDPALAAELMRSAFIGQDPDGGLCRRIRADGCVVDSAAPWPRLLAGARPVCEADPALRDWIQPRGEAWLRWAHARFDPRAEGRFCWPTPDESPLPRAWDEGLASVGLVSLLLGEIEAFRAIIGESGSPSDPQALHTFEQRLQDALTALRDGPDGVFRDRYPDGRAVQRETLPTYFPLLLDGIPASLRTTLSAGLTSGPLRRAGGGFVAWEPWPGDPEPPPAPLALQPLALEALERADPAAADRARAAIRSILVLSWQSYGVPPHDLREAAKGTGDPVAEVILAGASKSAATTPSMQWMERHRSGLLAVLLALMVLPVLAIFWLAHQRVTLPASTMESIISLGRQSLAAGQSREAEFLLRDFIRRTGNPPGAAHLWLGNALFRQGRFSEAEAEYRIGLDDGQSSLQALYNLGLTLHRLGRPDEAVECFDALIEAYDEELPDVTARARAARALIREQQRAGDAADDGAGLINAP